MMIRFTPVHYHARICWSTSPLYSDFFSLSFYLFIFYRRKLMLHKLELCVYLVMAVYWLAPMCPWPVKVDRGREDMSKCVCEKKQTNIFPFISLSLFILEKRIINFPVRTDHFIILHYVYALHTKRGEGNINFSRPAVNFLWCSECQNLFFFFIHVWSFCFLFSVYKVTWFFFFF